MTVFPLRQRPQPFFTICSTAILLLLFPTAIPCSQAWICRVSTFASPINRGKESRSPRHHQDLHDDGWISGRRRTVMTNAFLLLSLPTIMITPTDVSARNLPISTGADLSNVGTVEALIPILAMRQNLQNLQRSLQTKSDISTSLLPSFSLINTMPTNEQDFKRLFDAYSVPPSFKQKFLDQNAFLVYYTRGFDGPGRKNIEAGEDGSGIGGGSSGGGTVNELQTLQYGARNEAWIAWEEFLAEWDYVSKSSNEDAEIESVPDLTLSLGKAIQAVDAYLQLAPPDDFQGALEELSR